MNLPLILIFSIPIYIFLSVFITGFYDFLKAAACAKKVKNNTVAFINNIGFVCCCSGQQGAGKSTMASGITNMLIDKLKANASQRIKYITSIYPNFNFSKLDSFIIECFKLGYYNTDYIIVALFQIDQEIVKTFKFGFFDDGINYVANLENLRDYIDASISLLRNNYSYFLNRQFYCRITQNYAMPLTYESISIKDRYINKNYNLYRYSVLFQDEMLLAGGSNLFWQSETKNDTGISDYLRLIRHIGKKNMYFIGTAQDFNRLPKSRRELFNSINEIYQHKEIKTNKVRYWFLETIESITNYIYILVQESLTAKYRIKYVGKRDKFFRKILNWVELRKKKLEARWFVCYDGVHYSDPEDYLKPVDKCLYQAFPFRIYFPLPYVYGCLNTFEYSSIHDVLSYESKDFKDNFEIRGKPTMKSREDFAKDILKKVKAENTTTFSDKTEKGEESTSVEPFVPAGKK